MRPEKRRETLHSQLLSSRLSAVRQRSDEVQFTEEMWRGARAKNKSRVVSLRRFCQSSISTTPSKTENVNLASVDGEIVHRSFNGYNYES